MSETLDYIKMFAQFPLSLRRFLRHRLTLEDAQRIIRDRMAHRPENFLRIAEQSIYGNPNSPYLPLLNMAGYKLSDLRALVNRKGLEPALMELREAGVYITFEEFKGRKPVRRGSLEYSVKPSDFDNPFAQRDFIVESGGSTGAPMNVSADLDHIAARAPHRMVTLAAHGLLDMPTAIWQGVLPSNGMRLIFFGAYTGQIPMRWFSPEGGRESRHWLKYGFGTYYLITWLRLFGVPVPMPQHVKIEDAIVVARWAADAAKKYGRCLVRTAVSRGVRLAIAAQEAGLDLTGVTITGGGEPPTEAKVNQMLKAGAKFIPNYGMTEAGQPGSGCVNPIDGSDVHLFKDSIALFTHPHYLEGTDVSVPAFNMTSLLPTVPKVLLNVEVDDYGIVEERNCGCELESYGYTTHIRQIRSYSKLTGEGVTLVGTEMMRILNDVLPSQFGGTPLDYQLMEHEDEQGFTRLALIVSPRIQISDEQAVIDCILEGMRQSSPTSDAARIIWKQSQMIHIKRMEPVWTERGKLLPLHIPRRHK